MTGLDAHEHGVVRNGFPLDPGHPVLAERFAASGWHTIAVVGSSALESRMQLGRGFAVYDDAVGIQVRRRFEDPAMQVLARVRSRLEARRAGPKATQPLLLFVHFFDPHSPWDGAPTELFDRIAAPVCEGRFTGSGADLTTFIRGVRAGTASAADRRCARALYLSEVAAVDQAIGDLLQTLDADPTLGDRLTVVFGDHGETLDEIAERPYQHGLDVDLGSIHVPLIWTGQGRFDVPVLEVDRIARLQDLGTTMLGLAGLADKELGKGVSLEDAWWPPEGVAPLPPPHFAEATKPFGALADAGWPNATLERAVADDGYLYTRAAYRGEPGALFGLAPGQPLVVDQGSRAAELDELLVAWDAQAPAAEKEVELHPETEAALRELGYLP
jgi:arylsulfatase A-like enzyme